MTLEEIEASLPDYLAKCGVPRETIQAIRELRENHVTAEAERWWASGEHTLTLIGGVGAGKTVAACSVLRHNWRAISVYLRELGDLPSDHRWRSGVYVDMADLSQRGLFDDAAQMLRHRAQESEVAILDDTGRERGDGAQALEAIYLARRSAGRRTLITANLDPSAANQRLGARVYDRASNGGSIYNCGVKSLRGAA